ncbi:cytochrome b/b6 domain-containing protein [Pseudomonas sp. WJP1]|uniref:cytochrome b n=1 Tax=Pseudomonas sp. WJP1 TaxID=2986947 RepID=UPI00234A3F60|nr:cytochrome b/b6 domain-containing protein [Pseudomonas sp. WJP1]WCM51785.1 cytochrome b/b6 domain-containing protein [Pseudomonas sp. WJP1]
MMVSDYSRQRVLLHWISAAVILWALASGFYVAGMDVSSQVKHLVAFINVSLTTAFIPVFVWRLFIFVYHTLHVSVVGFSTLERLVLLAHSLIYLTVSVVLVTGVLMMDRPINVFEVVKIPQPLINPGLIASFTAIHVWACVVLSVLIALHVGAVIVHEVSGRRILRRMSL